MKSALALMLAGALATHLPSYADWKGNAASQALTREGEELYSRGKVREALDKYQAAVAADPTTSYPVSLIANVVYVASTTAKGEERVRLRAKAEEIARAALKLEPINPVAQEILRVLLDDGDPPLAHQPIRDAELAHAEGEKFFRRGDYAGALKQYALALQLDPLYALAWVDAGDCYYARQDWTEAERHFRKATALEPMLGQAWRFLSDALLRQNRRREGEAALYGGIAAQPSQLPNWDKLALLWRGDGLPLKPLHLVFGASATTDPATQKTVIQLNPDKQGAGDGPDGALWLAYAMTSGSAGAQNAKGGTPLTPFQIELAAWRQTAAVAQEMLAKTDKPLRDPGLIAMLDLAKANQLEAAILLLLYRERYRAEFEAWKTAHPDGIRLFVASTGMRP